MNENTSNNAVPNTRLRNARLARGLTLREVADALDIPDKQQVRRWERGVNAPRPHYRRALCELFGKTMEELGFNLPEPTDEEPAAPITVDPQSKFLQRIAENVTMTKNGVITSGIKEVREEETSNSSLISKPEHSVEKAITIKEQPEQLKLVYCYARKDKALREALDSHLSVLKHNYHVITWFDHEIGPGIDWEKEIDIQLNTAHIILLLVSPDFMASKYCYGVEMRRAIERHERGEAKVIPIILRPISWQDTPLGKLQGLPRNGKPVVDPSWGKRDYALHNVEKDLKAVIHNLISMPSASSVMPSLRAASAHLESENGQNLIVFKHRGQEDAYRKWVLAHRDDGLIVVKDATRWRLHHATCRHIIDPIEKGQSLLTYPKICSTSRAKLDTEATKQGGTILTGCYCHNKYPRS